MVTSAPRDSDLRRARQEAIIASVDPRGVLSRPPANYEARAAMSPLDHLSRFKDARVLVVGDVMLDRFVYARVSRLSPEAPVPVLAVEREALSLGGAGNVARNIASLGGHATLIRGADKSSGVFTPVSEVLMRIHRGLKQAFDPASVFNRGRLYADL